jgi:methionyl aminopeptidase
MSIIIKNDFQIEKIREASKRLAFVMNEVVKKVKPGISAKELDEYAEKLILDGGDIPAFKNYKPSLHSKPYPNSLCVSVNNEIVHGVPHKEKVIKDGDIVSLDLGLKHEGYFSDHAVTVIVGSGTKDENKLLKVTRDALYAGIDEARVGNRIGDIGFKIGRFASQNGLGNIRDLAGHGVGVEIHEDPFIPNYGKKKTGALLKAGMIIAIEPMFTLGTYAVSVLEDGYTVVTKDRTSAAHFEHTILITENDPEILTEL